MEIKRILLNNERLKVSTILDPIKLDVDLNEEIPREDDFDLTGDWEL